MDTAGARLRKQVESDIDKHLRWYQTRHGNPASSTSAIRSQYIEQAQLDVRRIRASCSNRITRTARATTGTPVRRRPALIRSTVEAVADVWFTVMRPEGTPAM